MNRRQFFATSAAAVVSAGLPAVLPLAWPPGFTPPTMGNLSDRLVECDHEKDWDITTQSCKRCGTTLKQIMLKIFAAAKAEAEKPRDERENPMLIYPGDHLRLLDA